MNASDIIFYTTPQGEVRIEVYFEDEIFWLSKVFVFATPQPFRQSSDLAHQQMR